MTLYSAARENVGLDAELTRLEAQAALGWRAEQRRLRQLPVARRPAILELGCGPGFVTARLAETFPGCSITALDCDPELLGLARARTPGARFVQADAAATGLPDAAFDLVLSRYLFQHLHDPGPVAAEAMRVLRPGGTHAIVDVDDGLWGLAEPAFPRMQAIHAKASALQQTDGRQRNVGRRLWSILNAAGCDPIDVDVFCYGSDWLGLAPFLPQLDPARLLPFVVDGRLPMGDYIAAQAMTDAFAAEPAAQVLMLGFIGSGRRPR
jgi:SAM-dependent methyltransferase